LESVQRAALAAGRLVQAVARLQHQPELDQRVRDVRVPWTLDRLIAGDRQTAGPFRRREATIASQRDRSLVSADGRNQRVAVAIWGDGCLRAGIVPSRPGMSARAFFAPEVIQTSAMDCGPAALKCLLEGFGVGVSYGRLREACQTSVDGTSIDTIEALAQSLGLDAEQVMMPVDHLLLAESDALPAIVVVRLPSGLTHFVVVWRAHGGWVQVMDPGRGRRWVRRATFLRDVYKHSLAVPAAAFREWAGSEGFTAPLERRLRALGIDDGRALVERALADPGWPAIAGLDRAVRAVEELAAAGAVSRGAEARRLVDALATAREAGASAHATASAAPPAADGSEQVTMRGAVLLRVSGAAALDEERRAALPVELRAAVDEPRVRVGAELYRLLRQGGVRWRVLAAGVVLAALGTVVEAVLFRALFDTAGRGLFVVIVALLAALLAVELPLAWGLRRAGAALDERFRDLFMRKIPRLGDRYFQSRPVSDMAERAHLVHKLRALPTLAGDIARTALEIVVIVGALVWLDPGGAALAIALGAAMLLIPVVAEPVVAERDLRMRNHAGALGRFYLDGLLGLVTIRTHGAEPALAREHQDRLGEWVRAARAALRAALGAEAMQALVGFGLATWFLADFFARTGARDPGAGLLAVYWALSLPMLGYELALFVQQVPAQRSLTLRLVEPLGAPEEREDEPTEAALGSSAAGEAAGDDAISIQMNDVRVVAAGHEILDVGALAIASGEHVAIVGPSGAGKSSLVGLLLGWHRPAAGTVSVDGRTLGPAELEALRQRTVWVDPSVYLWNRSLAANLAFGLSSPPDDLAPAMGEADLEEVAGRLPRGAETPLGEAGGLLSGGEGQRVRFGRGVLRPRPALVILDEPFRGLAREQRAALLARARRRWSDATLLCVTHDIGETERFARVLVIADGKIVEDGAPGVLRARPASRYAALLQAEGRVRAASWSASVWRRLRLERGRIVEGDR
jgi:ABC-type bacteriocin/lantibiotic exporter with double-glycine peptidase domain